MLSWWQNLQIARAPPCLNLMGIYMIAWLVLPSTAAFNGRGDATCEVAGSLPASCLLQRSHNKMSAKIGVQEFSQQVASVGSKDTGAGGQQSIFALAIAKIDNKNFWMVMTGMLLFTAAVDRLQAGLEYLASNSIRRQTLLARMNSELMMFGVVAVSLFVVTNLVQVDTVLFLQVEYVDILCSLTCIFLMAIVAGYFALYTKFNKFHGFEEYVCKDDELPTGNKMDAPTFQALANQFRARHKLPQDLVFYVYLKECIVLDCCDIMNVRWYIWVILMVGAMGFYSIKGYGKSTMADAEYLMLMLVVKVIVFLVFALIAFIIHHEYSALVKVAPEVAAELQKPESSKLDDLVKDDSGHNILFFALQSIVVVNAFLMMHFFMHEVHIIRSLPQGYYWYLSLIPLVLNVMPLLPASLVQLSFVDGCHSSNHEALDAVMTEISMLDEDLRYIRMLYTLKGEPPVTQERQYDYKAFKEHLLEKELDLHVSEQRAKRLWTILDLDESGTIEAKEFFEVINDSAPSPSARQRLRYARTTVLMQLA